MPEPRGSVYRGSCPKCGQLITATVELIAERPPLPGPITQAVCQCTTPPVDTPLVYSGPA